MKILLTSNIEVISEYPVVSDADLAKSPFKKSTGTEYYDRFLDPDQHEYMRRTRNRVGNVVFMTPTQYFEACAKDVFDGQTVESLKQQREYSKSKDGNRFVDTYRDAMLSGDKFPLPFIDIADPAQEGLHRMYAAGEAFGWDTPLPVLTITVYDQKLEDEWNFQQEVQDFNRNTLKYYCQAALDEISDWYGPVPDQFPHLLQNLILQQASNDGYDINIDIEVKEVDDHGDILHQVLVYLTEYMGHEITALSEPYVDWLENLYDVTGERSSKYSTKSDDDDLDIDNLLFL